MIGWMKGSAGLFTRLFCVVVAMAVLGPMAMAQEWPTKAVKIIVPSTPGDGSDITARLFADKLAETFKQPFVVENKPGAGGVIGTEAAAKSPADGYTFIMGNAGSHGINAAIYSKLPYDVINDFAAVSLIFRAPNIFVANNDLGVKTLADLVRLAKSRPEKLNYASGGNGSSAHLNSEYLKLLAGFDASHVPYRGASPALNDVAAGHVNFMSANLPPALALVKGGRLTPLAVTTLTRSPALPDVPTVAESGFPEFETIAWFGLLAPKGTPGDVIAKLHREVARICALPDLRGKLEGLGGDAVCNTPDEFGQRIRADVARWKKVAAAANVKID